MYQQEDYQNRVIGQPQYGTANSAIPKSNSPIENAFNRTRNALEAVDERISDLEKRLYPVLAPASTACLKGGALNDASAPPIAPMQENVDAITTAVLRQAERLRDLLDYLQL